MAVKIRRMLCLDTSIKMNVSMVKKAVFLKGLVAQDCMIVYPTCNMLNWLLPAAGAHAVIGKTFISEEQF